MKAAFRIFVLVIAAGYYSAPADAAGSAPAVLFVHAWLPELGPLENAPASNDAKLLKMAELARYGDFTAATDLANAMLAAHPEPRVRYLVLMFRHQLTRRLVRLPGGSAIPLSEDLTLIRMMHSAQDHADVSEAKQLASSLGKQDMDQLAAIRQVETIMDRCLENPLFLRYGAVPPNMAAAIDQNTREWDVTCKQNVSDFTEPDTSPQQFAADHELMALLVDSRMAIQARDDLTTAKLDLQKGLQLVHRKNWPASESLWLLREGDLEASPRGSVLILGYELTAEKNVRSDLNLGHLEGGKTYDSRHGSPVEAAKYYDQAERLGIANFAFRPSDIAIRRALLRFLQGEPAGAAYRRAANLARGEDSPWNETMARTCAGVLSGTRSEFDKGVEAAEKASLPAGEFSMAQVVMSWNQRAVRDGDSASTIEELGAMAGALPIDGFQISRAEMMVMRSGLENNLGRSDASIDSQYIAINAEKAFLRTVADNKPKAAHDAGFGEIVFETSLRAIILEQLVQLKFYLQMREVSEGMIVYAERRSAIEKEVEDVKALMAKEYPQELSTIQFLEMSLQAKSQADDLKSAAAQVDRFGRSLSCAEILHRFDAVRNGLDQASTPMPVLRGLIMAGSCDPALHEQVRTRLSTLHPVEDVKAALAQAPDSFSPQRILLVSSAVSDASILCTLAEKADAGTLLEQWASCLGQVMTGLNSSGLPNQELTYFHARALAIEGKFSSANRLLSSIELDEPFWSYQAPRDLRENVLEARVEAEVNSGTAESALLASERARAEREHADEVVSGVRVADPNSAEAAMLLRRAAVEGDFDRQRMAELQRTAVAGSEQFRLPTMDDLQAGIKSLPAGVTVLVFHPLRNELAIWRIDAGERTRLIRVPVNSGDLIRLTQELRGRLAGSEAGWAEPAEALFKYLIAPAGPIEHGRTLAIFGVGRLGGIPLEALTDSQGHSLSMANPVVYVSALADTRRWPVPQRNRTKSLVAGINAGGLTAPEVEANAVAAHLKTVALTGSSTTLERVREGLPQARLIHLATHGVLDARNPYRSYLAMANGRLEAWNLFHDIAGADLIVLSACDTKLGPRAYMKQMSSDESSITGFILRAGARRVVSSLWGATDSATESLMDAFYTALEHNPRDPARALQLAKASLAKPGRHPYTYANFVLSVQNPAAILLP